MRQRRSGTSTAFAPDGQTLACGGGVHNLIVELKLWDLGARRLLQTLVGHQESITAAAFAPRAPLLATASQDRTVKLWELPSGRLRQTLSGHKYSVNALAFAPDDRTLASGSTDTTVKWWDIETQQERVTLSGHRNGVTAVVFAPDGSWFASGDAGGTVWLWDREGETRARWRRTRKISWPSGWARRIPVRCGGRLCSSGSGATRLSAAQIRLLQCSNQGGP